MSSAQSTPFDRSVSLAVPLCMLARWKTKTSLLADLAPANTQRGACSRWRLLRQHLPVLSREIIGRTTCPPDLVVALTLSERPPLGSTRISSVKNENHILEVSKKQAPVYLSHTTTARRRPFDTPSEHLRYNCAKSVTLCCTPWRSASRKRDIPHVSPEAHPSRKTSLIFSESLLKKSGR